VATGLAEQRHLMSGDAMRGTCHLVSIGPEPAPRRLITADTLAL
jgi:hypothetical protein